MFICSKEVDKDVKSYYHELMGNIEEREGKQFLMVDDYMLDKVLDKIKMILGIEKFDNTKILIKT